MSVIYENPPLIEAICDFKFAPGQTPWSWVVPGMMYELIKDRFPFYRDQSTTTPAILDESLSQAPLGPLRVQFFNSDGSLVVQVSPDSLSINHLLPYTNWENYLSVILDQFSAYVKVVQPLGLELLQMRYINRLNIPRRDQQQVAISQYCRVLPAVPAELDGWMSDIVQRMEIVVPGSQSRLAIQSRMLPQDQPEILPILVDLEYAIRTDRPMALDSVSESLVEAHTEIERVFHACFTDQARQIFGQNRRNEHVS